MESVGLTTSIREGLAKIEVCGKECKLVDAESTDTKAVCELNYIQTAASAAQFEQENDSSMETSFLFGSSAAVIPLIDRTFLPGIKSSGAGCYLGVGYRGGHKALFSELRFFMDYFPDKSKYVGNLKL